ncbi:hypothetical protein N0V84_003486 [Fusarium piperis]|uniref:Uncharacterized protein n=1 Tax=Fusarium piperis TaxID=1435070 RepID=A0A9W8WHQ6_9HYPO|nr:hypothetical protein N0V84_003486 [Fusarium piperis]
MCMYSQSVFSCQHKRWGLRIRLCKDAEDFIAGKTCNDCCIRKPYMPTSRKLQMKCKKCAAMDAKINKARKMIGSIRETMEEVQRKDEDRRERKEQKGGKEEEKKESVDHSQDYESDEEEEEEAREVETQGQNEENGQRLNTNTAKTVAQRDSVDNLVFKKDSGSKAQPEITSRNRSRVQGLIDSPGLDLSFASAFVPEMAPERKESGTATPHVNT